ncbi:MAG: type II secretion system secretin GspD [Kiritimatiellae bacterium]|nr:type II secretion system secretin GspD [Kiritimatiellia bacterium]
MTRLRHLFLSAALAALALPCAAQEAAPADRGDFLSFNFDRVDVRAFTKVVGSFTGKRFVVPEGVEGTITVVSPPVSREEAYGVFAAILESNGFALQREGGLERVVALPDRAARMGEIVPAGEALPEHGLATRIFRLDHIPAEEMRKTLEAQLGQKDAVSVLEETNHLIVSDTAERLRRVQALVEQLDKPGMAAACEVIALEHADAAALARQLTVAFSESATRASQLRARLPAAPGAPADPLARAPVVVASEHANQLLVTGSQRQIQTIRDLVAKLDVAAPTGRSALNAIVLKFLKAEDFAKNVTTLLEKFSAGNTDPSLARRIAVEAVPEKNAILVNAAPEDFRAVEALVAQLDVKPRQVHIEVVIAEVQEGAEETLGVQFNVAGSHHGATWGGGSHPNAESAGSALASAVGSQVYPEGLAAAVVNKAGQTIGVLNVDALRQNSDVKILATPSVSAQNHTTAEVTIVDNIPMTESTVTGTGGDKDVVQTITRYDVGVKLAITPHVVPGGEVQMELEPSIEAVTSGGTGGDYAPTIAKRTVKTVQTARDGETIAISGLTRADTTTVERRVPLLGSIPLLGWLFRWDSEVERRTSILVFVTPTILDDDGAPAALRERLETRTGLSATNILEEISVPGGVEP